MKVLPISRYFPVGHSKKGQPTYFPEKIWSSLADTTDLMMGNLDIDWYQYYNGIPKGHTIRNGNKYRAGDIVSLRMWSGRPYWSKPVEIAKAEILKTYNIEIHLLNPIPIVYLENWMLDEKETERLARNDGLTLEDFNEWFLLDAKKMDILYGQVICWDKRINY